MKHVWILNHYAQELGAPGGTRHYHLSQYLKFFGWQSTVIAASVETNTGRQRLSLGESWRFDHLGIVQFLWVWTPQHNGNGIGRVANMLAYTLQVLRPAITRILPRPDVIIGSSVHPFAAVAAVILARRFKVPFVFEVRDLWPQTLVDMGRLTEGAIVTNVLRKLEKWLFTRAARIIVLMPRASEYIAPLGIPNERIVWIPNGIDLSLYSNIRPISNRTVHNFTLMYFGAHAQANGLDNILKAMKEIQTHPNGKHIQLRMIGDGPLKSSLIREAQSLGLTNISFEAPVPKSEIPDLAAQADAFIFNLIDAPVFRFGISSNKLFDFMASGRPIIFSCKSANNPVNDARAGITVAPGVPSELSAAILEIAATPYEERQRMGQAGRIYVENNHSFQELAGRLATTLDDVLDEGHS